MLGLFWWLQVTWKSVQPGLYSSGHFAQFWPGLAPVVVEEAPFLSLWLPFPFRWLIASPLSCCPGCVGLWGRLFQLFRSFWWRTVYWGNLWAPVCRGMLSRRGRRLLREARWRRGEGPTGLSRQTFGRVFLPVAGNEWLPCCKCWIFSCFCDTADNCCIFTTGFFSVTLILVVTFVQKFSCSSLFHCWKITEFIWH